MSEFSLLGAIGGPGKASAMAIRRQVSTAAERQRPPAPGYVYGGMYDMLAQHGQTFNGRQLPDRWEHLAGESGECHKAAMEAAEAEPELRYFTGLYLVSFGACTHSWCVDYSGGVVELTYPTAAAPGSVIPFGSRQTNIPWLPPDHWAYIGLEFDAAFTRAAWANAGLPMLDPRAECGEPWPIATPDTVFRHPYRKEGWPL